MPLAVVTGCAGFIGSHLVDRLLRAGYTVRGVDRRDPVAGGEAGFNLAGALASPQFDFLAGDLLELDLPGVLEGADYVLHLAARPGVRGGWERDFDEYVRENILATQRLLRACSGRKLRRFVLASTSAVYGAAPPPYQEGGPTRPLSPYGMTKLAAEELVRMYGRQCGLNWSIVRYFTVYGPRQRPDMAFRRMMECIREGRPIPVYGDGSQSRDFTYVDDAVEATLAAMRSDRALRRTVNVAGGQPVSLKEAIRTLEQVVGRPVAVEHLPGLPGEMAETRAVTERARKWLEWQPRVALAEGLVRQWIWLERRHLQPAVTHWAEGGEGEHD